MTSKVDLKEEAKEKMYKVVEIIRVFPKRICHGHGRLRGCAHCLGPLGRALLLRRRTCN